MTSKKKPSRRQALRAFGRCEPPDVIPDPNVAIGTRVAPPLTAAQRADLEHQMGEALKTYTLCRAMTELERLRANGGFVH